MSENGESFERIVGVTHSQAAAQRIFQDLGEGVEAVRAFLGWQQGRELYPYQVTVKRPIAAHQDYLVMVKALEADQPVVAFHGGYGYIEALIGMGRRGRNGQLAFRVDEMPPKNLAKWQAEAAYYAEHIG